MRQIVLDTETTGLNPEEGHKIIEIGCVEIIDRKITENIFHSYIKPNRVIGDDAIKIHGITNEFLKDKPIFGNIVDDFLFYLSDSPLIIHNAPFDIAFLKSELFNLQKDKSLIDAENRKIYDTLKMSREMSPGKRNTLDALCERYNVDNSNRDLHGALLDARLLAEVYLKMTMGQTDISGLVSNQKINQDSIDVNSSRNIKIVKSSEEENNEHEDYFKKIN
tara:strand:- start:632 stop:1294 length:663 start_codon:yes stop_codon:yes gene_type:complete